MRNGFIMAMPSIAYYSGLSGLEIKQIEYGIEDYLYCVSGAWGAKSRQKCHRLKIYYDDDGGFVRLNGYKVPLNECIKTGV